MFDDLDETIRRLLIQELPIRNSEIDVIFDQPKRENSARWSKPTINLFLYDVRENNVLRQHQWERQTNGNGGGNLAHLKRTPFRIDCLYMLTTWIRDHTEGEHRLLGRTMQVLFSHPILEKQQLVGQLKNQAFELQTRLASHDKLTNPAEVWSALDNELRPSVSYIVTLSMDPWHGADSEREEPLVLSSILHSRQGNEPEAEARPAGEFPPDAAFRETYRIGGTVRSRDKEEALENCRVAVKGTSLVTTTDVDGHYRLGRLVPGEYTLLVTTPGEATRVARRKILVPIGEGDYDVDI